MKHEAQKSPQETRWFVLQEPQFAAGGPWNSVVTIYSNPDGPPLLRVTFFNHASYGVKPQWLNEKLVFMDVAWGRIVGTELILDVETGKTLYIEDNSLADFSGPCEHKQVPKR